MRLVEIVNEYNRKTLINYFENVYLQGRHFRRQSLVQVKLLVEQIWLLSIHLPVVKQV